MKSKITFFTILITFISFLNAQEGVNLELVKDINISGNSEPGSFIDLQGSLIFVATDVDHGRELWISDGTEGGTQLLKDIRTGTASSNPSQLTLYGNHVIFTAQTDEEGNEVWITDGTEAGTVILSDIRPGTASSFAFEFTEYNNAIFFRANNGSEGTELWKTDGTTSGTVMVSDIRNGQSGSNPTAFVVYNGLLYFRANDGFDPGQHGFELWVSDGTDSGTSLFMDINPNGNSNPQTFYVFDNMLYFVADDGTNGIELWHTDGTMAGTQIVSDINPNGNSLPSYLYAANNELFFTAYTQDSGRELWKTDGTEAGTVLVKDVSPGTGDGMFTQFSIIEYQNNVYFTGVDGVHGAEIWVTDGTESGTHVFKDIFAGSEYSISYAGRVDFQIYNGLLVFRAMDDLVNGYQLWLSDGTIDGTQEFIPDSVENPNALWLTPGFTVMGDSLYFQANFDGAYGSELYKLTYTENLSTEEFSATNFEVFPNPTTDYVTISSVNEDLQSVEVYNTLGKQIFNIVPSQQRIDLSQCNPGIYFLRLTSTSGNYMIKKIIKN
ncbi:ELWxxDGT repeat protein [Winogradskyella sp. SYSU M77433]|uniref:ELWxxDGT repeat protein n=1 Tax=Winogradskyella sp. SYSU M77433 TaxID=3042722 RepID=UPI002480DCB3|nr:ELWxxDGT repeat protein [Winogradskyella sp. SYSU M77433]MDH7911548.1 T9SS type A sorting domain-containing protein [Winogradskyella sp. SYSU M77433]